MYFIEIYLITKLYIEFELSMLEINSVSASTENGIPSGPKVRLSSILPHFQSHIIGVSYSDFI